MIKTIPGKFQNGKVIPLEKVGDTSECRIYITIIPIKESVRMTEKQFLDLAKKADALYKKNRLHEIRSLKELDV